MSYARGAIQRKRPPNLTRGQREYHGPCEGGCGQEIHTVGDPPRRLCVECIGKRDEGPDLIITPAIARAYIADRERRAAQAGGRT